MANGTASGGVDSGTRPQDVNNPDQYGNASAAGSALSRSRDVVRYGNPFGDAFTPPTNPRQGALTMPVYVGTVPSVVHSARQLLLGQGSAEEVAFIYANWPDNHSVPFLGGVGLTAWQLSQYASFIATYQSIVDRPGNGVSTDVAPMWLRDP